MTSDTSIEPTSLVSSSSEPVLVTTDSKGRLRVSKEQRKAVLAKFEQSGMSAVKFAAVAGIKYSTFAGWVQRYRRVKPRAPSKGVRFIEAVIGPNPSQGPAPRPEWLCICRVQCEWSCFLWPKCHCWLL